jgi:hypothetical protein
MDGSVERKRLLNKGLTRDVQGFEMLIERKVREAEIIEVRIRKF